MSDKEILFKKLDDILMGMFRYSVILGDWGKYVWIIIYLRDNGYSGESYVGDPKKIPDFKRKKKFVTHVLRIYMLVNMIIQKKFTTFIIILI
jgi:hypothetical protein